MRYQQALLLSAHTRIVETRREIVKSDESVCSETDWIQNLRTAVGETGGHGTEQVHGKLHTVQIVQNVTSHDGPK